MNSKNKFKVRQKLSCSFKKSKVIFAFLLVLFISSFITTSYGQDDIDIRMSFGDVSMATAACGSQITIPITEELVRMDPGYFFPCGYVFFNLSVDLVDASMNTTPLFTRPIRYQHSYNNQFVWGGLIEPQGNVFSGCNNAVPDPTIELNPINTTNVIVNIPRCIVGSYTLRLRIDNVSAWVIQGAYTDRFNLSFRNNTTSQTSSFTVSTNGSNAATASVNMGVITNITCADTPTVLNLSQNNAGCSTTLTATVSGGASPYTYTWTRMPSTVVQTVTNTTNTTDIYNATIDGTYWIQVTRSASSGCPAVSIGTGVVNTNVPTVSVSPTSITKCANGSPVTLTASGTNYSSFLWSTGETTTTISVSPTSTTNYTVTAVSAYPCTSAVATSTITVPVVTLTASATAVSQCGGTSTLTATATSPGTTITNVVWTAPGQTTVTGNPATVTPTGSVTYTGTVTTNPGSCVNTVTTSVTNSAAPSIAVTGGNNALCNGESTSLCATFPCTPLLPGDIAIVRYETAGIPVNTRFSIVALVDIPSCLPIKCTNMGYDEATNSFVGSGNTYNLPSPMLAGTTTTIDPNFNLNVGVNDQIIIYQELSPGVYNFIYAINKGSDWKVGAITNVNNQSNLPPGLTNNLTANSWNANVESRRYNSTTTGTKSSLLTSIGTNSNWQNNVFAPAIPTMTVTDAATPGFTWSTAATTTCITVSTPGTYTVTRTDIHGCVTTASSTIRMQGLQTNWATYFGGDGSDAVQEMDVDPVTHDIVIAGYTDGSPPTLPTTGATALHLYGTGTMGSDRDAFVARISADGTIVRWITYIGGTFPTANGYGREHSDGVKFDEYGNVYLTGTTESIDFPVTAGPPVDNNEWSPFVCKFNSNGLLQWSRVYKDGYSAMSDGITVTKDNILGGTVYITGTFLRNTCFDYDVFTIRLNKTNGAQVWEREFGGPYVDCAADNGGGIVHDALGDVYIAGGSAGPISDGTYDLNCNPVSTPSLNYAAFEAAGIFNTGNVHVGPVGKTNALAIKYNSTGDLISWHKTGAAGYDIYDGVDLLSNGQVVFVGYHDLILGGPPNQISTLLTRAGNVLGVTSSNANTLGGIEKKLLHGNGDDEGTGIEVDAQDNVYITGSTSSSNYHTIFGATSTYRNAITGGRDMFMARMRVQGTQLTADWFTYYGSDPSTSGTPGDERGFAIAVDPADNNSLYAVGFTGSTNFEVKANPTIPQSTAYAGTGNNATDGAVIKFNCNASSPCVNCKEESVDEIVNSELGTTEIKVYPNPFADELNILISGTTSEVYKIELYDLKGIKLYELSEIYEQQLVTFNNNLNNGLYIMKVISKDFVKTIKVTKAE